MRFEHVSFAYQSGRSALDDIDFEVAPDQVIALIGPTGSGKSTITNLIPRFYDPTAGRVLIDGIDIRRCQAAAACANTSASCYRSPFLFNDTIAGQHRLWQAGRLA